MKPTTPGRLQTIFPWLSCKTPWLLAWLCLRILAIVRPTFYNNPQQRSTLLCIEAGTKGWESIEFKELYASASEYLGSRNVLRLEVPSNSSYVKQVKEILKNKEVTHYLYDPRTGCQEASCGLMQSLAISFLLAKHNVTPIAYLTDLSVRTWRAQAAVVTADRGSTISFMSARVMTPIFPHTRLIGPSLMPFSVETKAHIDHLRAERKANKRPKAIFTGSLYEPRTSVLREVERLVLEGGGNFECFGRRLGSPRAKDIDYWKRLVDADIVFTTSTQMNQPGTDWTHIPHLLYRYLEALTCGTLLIAQDVPAVHRFFTPGEHFISYNTTREAADEILYYLENAESRRRIASHGHKRAASLINARTFWTTIDSCLGGNSML